MLGRALRTKKTLPDFFLKNMDPDKWDTTVWYQVTRNQQEFRILTDYQWDPWIWGVTLSAENEFLERELADEDLEKPLFEEDLRKYKREREDFEEKVN